MEIPGQISAEIDTQTRAPQLRDPLPPRVADAEVSESLWVVFGNGICGYTFIGRCPGPQPSPFCFIAVKSSPAQISARPPV
jgi:hypothetical protein